MNDLLFKLIGSPAIRLGEQGVELGFERALPAWAWALVAIAAAVLGVLAYRRIEGARAWRIALGTLRALLILLLALLISGPRLIKSNETEEKDWVLVLVDRSASLSIADAGMQAGKREPREQQLREILESAKPTFRNLAAQRVLVWLGFDSTAYDLPLDKQTGEPTLAEPVGRRTDIGRAIDGALKRSASRPISGVVLISDGRSVEDVPRAVIRRLEQEKIPVFPVALGSSSAVADVSVRRSDAPRYAFVSDVVPVDIEIARAGAELTPGQRTVVELIDSATGTVLDSREVRWGEAPAAAGSDQPEQTQRVTLTTRPSAAGGQKWTVRVRPPAGETADFVESNNASDLSIELVDRPLRIAYFDGYPRWEYRYLKELLRREQSATAAIMLLASGKRYIQEGTVILDALPRSPEEWANYDVIVLGDLWPGIFTPEQIGQIRDRVSIGGAGLIWIGGEGSTPGAWKGTLLSELLPFVIPEGGTIGGSGLPTMDGPVTVAPTPGAERLGIMRLLDTPVDGSWYPNALKDPAAGWSQLYWMQRIDASILKPTAEVLATATPVNGRDGPSPAVLSMRYGAGRVLYVATDEIWRWRYGRGELYPERFWIQLVRLLGRESIVRSGRPAILEASPERATMEQPVRVQVTLIDQALVDALPPTIRVSVTKEVGLGGPVSENEPTLELTLTPEAAASEAPSVAMRKITPRVFSGTWIPGEPGRYRVTTTDPLLASAAAGSAKDDLTAKVEVWQADDEMRRPQADHPALAKLAEQTGGQVLTKNDLANLPRLLPNRTLKLAGEPDIHTLWDTPLALILLLVLLTAEWIGRRLMRLA